MNYSEFETAPSNPPTTTARPFFGTAADIFPSRDAANSFLQNGAKQTLSVRPYPERYDLCIGILRTTKGVQKGWIVIGHHQDEMFYQKPGSIDGRMYTKVAFWITPVSGISDIGLSYQDESSGHWTWVIEEREGGGL